MQYQSSAHHPRRGRLLAVLVIALVVLMTIAAPRYVQLSQDPAWLASLTGVDPDELRALIDQERGAR